MTSSVYKKVGIASLIMMASIFLSRLIGLFREMAIAYVGGAKGSVDAYQVAFIIPEILNHVVASGFLSVTFIPIFSHYLSRNEEKEAWKVFSIIFTSFGILLMVSIMVALFFAPMLVTIFAPGLNDPVSKAKAIYMTIIIIPAQFFFFSGGLFMAVQFAHEKFFIPALAPLIYNVGIISGGLILGPYFGMEGFAWGVFAGAFVGNFALQLWGAHRVGMHFTFHLNFSHPDLIKYIKLTLPLIIGLTMTFSTEIFLKFFGSFLSEGSIASLNYGIRIMYILVAFFGQAVGVASYPFLAGLAAKKKFDEMNQLLNNTLKYLALVIPFSGLLMVLRHEIVLILFQRGKFDAAATATTSQLLVFLMIGAFAFAAQTVVVRGFYAMQNTLLPAIYGTIAVIFSLPVFYFGMQKMGVNGVALAISFSAILQVVWFYYIWNRKIQNPGSKSVYFFYFRIFLLSVPIVILLEGLKGQLYHYINFDTLIGCVVIALITGTIFLFLLLSGGYLLKIEEIRILFQRIYSRLN